MYKYETHLHTSEGSACAKSTGKEMVRVFKDNGYTGIFVTNHFINGNTSVDRKLPWDKWVEEYYHAYEIAKEEGEKIGLDVFFGFEYGFGGGTDLLTYGISKEFLIAHPQITKIGSNEYFDLIHKAGGFVVHAHPFRKRDYTPIIKLFFDLPDAIEVINASHDDDIDNDRAYWYAKSYNLPITAGSDAHDANNPRFGGILTDEKFIDEFSYLDALKNGKIRGLLKRKPQSDNR